MENNNNKKLIIIISIIILIIVIIISTITYIIKVNNKINYYKYNKEIEVYNKIKIKDIVPSNIKIIENKYIDTNSIGIHKYKFKYKIDNKRRKYNGLITYKVIDNIEPLVSISNTYYTYLNEEFNIDNHSFYGDNYSRKLDTKIIGYYDINKLGSYKLLYEVKDESNNKVVLPFTLKVIKKENNNTKPSIPNKYNGISIDKLKNKINKNNNEYLMIDVSKWQGKIDWEKVKNSGIDYAMIRIGTQKGIGLDSKIDEFFYRNIKEAKKNNIKVGIYYFTYATNKKEAKEQAIWVNKIIKKYKLDLPVAFDWESFEYFKIMNINFHDLNEIAKTFIKEIEKNNNKAILYSSKSKLETIWDKDYDIWLAHYTNNTNYLGNKIMWQFTNKGLIPGINGYVDVNILYKN